MRWVFLDVHVNIYNRSRAGYEVYARLGQRERLDVYMLAGDF